MCYNSYHAYHTYFDCVDDTESDCFKDSEADLYTKVEASGAPLVVAQNMISSIIFCYTSYKLMKFFNVMGIKSASDKKTTVDLLL